MLVCGAPAVAIGRHISDKMIDDDDMARKCQQICPGQTIGKKECPALCSSRSSSLNTSALWCYTALDPCENYVNCTYNVFFRKFTFLPRNCNASLMFVMRDLPTCKMLIRKHAYISL